jgi:hypothetical protein
MENNKTTNISYSSSSKNVFGCCWDGTTLKSDYQGSNCPPNYGYCSDNVTIKKDKKGSNCFENINHTIKKIVENKHNIQDNNYYDNMGIYGRNK